METKIFNPPYEPHRYVDELPATAWANLAVWIDSVRRHDHEPKALAYTLDVDVARPVADLFKDVAAGILKLQNPKSQAVAIRVIFGSLAEREVIDIIQDLAEEADPEMPTAFHNLQGRILFRIGRGTFNDLDLAWVQRKAVDQVTDEDMLGVDAFSGDQGEARELSRRVIRGRKDHTCHWTGRTIPAGEPHLVLSEVMEGDFIKTRHSRLACWFHVYGGDLALAEMLKPAEPPLAAAA